MLLPVPALAQADEPPPRPRGTFGNVGMIDMPTARMSDDGEIYGSISAFHNTQHYDLGFQALPWLQTSFRYTGLQRFEPGIPVYFDRSFAVKARLWNEGSLLPSVAVGINDLVGTGIFSGEYIVASKQFGDFDATVGMGWGRLAGSAESSFRNPLGAISHPFYNRGGAGANGGQFALTTYFHGDRAAAFGGINWRTPLNGLTLSAEYSSDAYSGGSPYTNFYPKNQFNYALDYAVTDGVDLNFGWLYGTSLYGGATFTFNPAQNAYTPRLGPPPPPIAVRTQEQQEAALKAMMAGRNGIADRRHSQQLSDTFVDMLYRSGFSDVRITGRELQLTSSAPSAQRCAQYAQLVRSYQIELDTVSVASDASPRRVFRCGTPRMAPAPMLIDAALPQALAQTPVITIDGASGGPPSAAALKAATARLKAAIEAQDVSVEAIRLTESEATIYLFNGTYRTEDAALNRVIRVLMRDAPPSIERFRLVMMAADVPARQFDVLRAPMEREMTASPDATTLLGAAIFQQPAPMENPLLSTAAPAFPRFNWSVYPNFRQMLFDPNQPFGVQFLTAGSVNLELWRGFSLNAEGELSLYDNFDTSLVANSASLPPVRTNFSHYFTEGKNGIGQLEADYMFRVTPEIYGLARVGILESMFAGAGGEILWRPEGARWALGADAFEVQQRSYDRLLDLQSYRAFTGHVTLYYQSPWYDLNFQVSAGKYLAGDRGLTFQVSRRFENGVEVGVFFTKTNVSSQDFGEGSFDKGILISIPLDYAMPVNTQAAFSTVIRPVQRDGGQKLLGDAVLYNLTDPASHGTILDHVADFADH